MSNRPLNVGLVGGGCGAFIAQPHQKAIFSDGTRRVVAAALHPNPEIAMSDAANWPYPIKGYPSYIEYPQIRKARGRTRKNYLPHHHRRNGKFEQKVFLRRS